MMMTYKETIDFLFSQLPVFQSQGPGAYKPGLATAHCLDDMTGNPHRRYKTIHIAGTNGKGSTAHSIAAVLMEAGFKTGLYTSPHLIDFRERIKVNGKMIPQAKVIAFVDRFKDALPELHPSFFELTTAMAFEYFAEENVDYAVIETGLGGRLDSTNIITPILSVITNISLDHTALLGSTRAEIAREKAGIIKPGVDVVVGESDIETRPVYVAKAAQTLSRIHFVHEKTMFDSVSRHDGMLVYSGTPYGDVECDLTGGCQPLNMATVLTSLQILGMDRTAVVGGLCKVASSTGLAGRWMKFGEKPLRVCDTGHNAGGWEYLSRQIASFSGGKRRIVLGFVNDKSLDPIFRLLMPLKSDNTMFYFTRPSVPRGLAQETLATIASGFGLSGQTFSSVSEAYEKALADSGEGDMIFVGGSTFVVADLLAEISGGQ